MIIFNNCNGKRQIQMKLSEDVDMNITKDKEDYIVKAPIIICNNITDAKYIQKKLNTYANIISRELLNNI